VHQQHEVDTVLRFVAGGLNDSQISSATGINRTSIREWRRNGPPPRRRRTRPSACPRCDGVPLDEPGYAYLLGLYLGDGCISRGPRAYRLRIVQDARYSHLITLTEVAIARVRGGSAKVGSVRKVGCVEIYSYWQHWPCLFPQHGLGRKHLRAIILQDWQRPPVTTYPKQLIRGLIHSDGCRSVNRVWKGRYEYPRYFFTNTSDDIQQIFKDASDAIEVAYRNSRVNAISIARRRDVARLDSFIGPKA
jgi:hypothetical protein